MSKLLDSLARKSRKMSSKNGEISPKMFEDEHDQSVQQELIRTYFSTPAARKARAKAKGPAQITTKTKLVFFGWMAGIFGILLLILILLSVQRIDVHVSLAGNPGVQGSMAAPALPKDTSLLRVDTTGLISDKITENSYFTGMKDGRGGWGKDHLTLNNFPGSSWKAFCVDLKDPMDLEGGRFSFFARGKTGGERLKVVFRDADERSYPLSSHHDYILTKNWQRISLPIDKLKNAIDVSRVKHFRFEYGSAAAKNKPNTVIHLKDIVISE